jgi:hypothetical protein
MQIKAYAREYGDPSFVVARIAPRWGDLTREVLAINMVNALTDQAFNLNRVQATTHVAAPLLIEAKLP